MPETVIDFQSIHDAFRPRILRYLARLAGEREAEDLTQVALLKVQQGLPQFRGDSSLSTWIYRVATNCALDQLRSSKAEETQSCAVALQADGEYGADEGCLPVDAQIPSAETEAMRAEMNACIREFIEQLPEAYKTVIVLSELEGFKNAEIACILGLSLDAVKMRLHRAREQLREDLKSGCNFDLDERNELACDRKPLVFSPRRRA